MATFFHDEGKVWQCVQTSVHYPKKIADHKDYRLDCAQVAGQEQETARQAIHRTSSIFVSGTIIFVGDTISVHE
jgi:hypothetical protein